MENLLFNVHQNLCDLDHIWKNSQMSEGFWFKWVWSAAVIKTCNARADCGCCLTQMRDGCCPRSRDDFHLQINIWLHEWLGCQKQNLSKKSGSLCSVDRISVTLSLALNRVSFDSFFISLLNDVPFVRVMRLWDDKRIWEMGEVSRKMCRISLPVKTVYSSVGIDSCFEFFGGGVHWLAPDWQHLSVERAIPIPYTLILYWLSFWWGQCRSVGRHLHHW